MCVSIHVYTHTHTKAFLLCFIQAWERTTTTKKDGEIGKRKWNEYEIEKMKQTI